MILDTLGRALRDLRVSVTDRCNFRCVYCMPKDLFGREHAFLPPGQILSYEEIARVVGILRGLGLRKVRLTGGEPLLRRGLPSLVRLLAAYDDLDLALTTNGSALAAQAPALAAAGLRRVTVSLDALDDRVFRAMNDVDFPVARVLEGIDAAAAAGLAPVKVNAVVRRGMNDGELVPLARRFRGTGHVLRFIEYMDVGTTNGWRMDDVVPADEIVATVDRVFPLEPVAPDDPSDTARRWRYKDGAGELGVVASVTRAFCAGCTRARLSADGRLYTCLFASTGFDLRALLRAGASDADVGAAIEGVWRARADRYSELRAAGTPGLPRIEMSFIGG
ncbi:MAG: GTP 3',8-cyclase MoaA [Planctomycetota bacterium]